MKNFILAYLSVTLGLIVGTAMTDHNWKLAFEIQFYIALACFMCYVFEKSSNN
jgi:peptidoglycan/LPS O-acetylase OafA/YrhL